MDLGVLDAMSGRVCMSGRRWPTAQVPLPLLPPCWSAVPPILGRTWEDLLISFLLFCLAQKAAVLSSLGNGFGGIRFELYS